MGKIKIVAASPRHIGPLARTMRAIDVAECASMGHTPKAALRRGLLASEWAMTALLDGEPQAMFGLVVESAIEGVGVPWFLGTDAVYCHPRAMLKHGPVVLALMGDSSRVLRNLVSAGNTRAIRLLERWGFVVDPQCIDVRGQAFRWFEKVM
jgi:hypothetical protein